ncbi:ArsR/SmtB family transcription factor [Canibacter zhoujuaniae]|uniref:ArsR/SmtB family transcription factor n=1 Tax=Canibacter zhoujuaniae TaxID=2708343 RepID=UPI001422CE09|nr:metalloregulator ArsR/SmtB family transcription factor [Canibacter zhoujuaniae]
MADIFSVIADATRRDILTLLLDRPAGEEEMRVSDIVDELDISQPTVSKHLKVLREADMVEVREEGQSRFYKLQSEPLNEVEDFVLRFLTAGVSSEISVEYVSETGQVLSAEELGLKSLPGSTAGGEEPVLPSGAKNAAESIGRAAATATNQVKELVARFRFGQ